MNQTNLSELFWESTNKYGNNIWSIDTDAEIERTYSQFGELCQSLSDTLSSYGVRAGDKVAIFSSSTPNWSVAFFAATAFGRVAVPVLPDFSGNEAEHVLVHSGSKALVVGKKQYAKFREGFLDRLNVVIDIETLEILHANPSPCVSTVDEDAIVISRNNRLVCLVKAADSLFDLSKVEVESRVKDAVTSFKKKVTDHVNAKVNTNSRLSSVELMKVPFEKTATLKIRRFLYATEAPTI